MSNALINRSPDLKRLRDEGYEVEVQSAMLLVHHIPYANASKQVQYATLASTLNMAGERVLAPDTHVAFFTGDHPCHRDGTELTQIKHGPATQALGGGLVAKHSFSNRPSNGYGDYYEKMTRYIAIITAPAQALDPTVTVQTFKPIVASESDSVFQYLDTASSRSGILALADKLTPCRLAIVGLGGTGSYVLDFVAKTPVREIHLFDGDELLTHNAFRAPGAVSLQTLNAQPKKVDYYAAQYAVLRRNIIPHPYHITADTVAELQAFDFVFVCVDKGKPKEIIYPALRTAGIPFIDVGMGIELVDGALNGILRVTTATNDRHEHLKHRVSLQEGEDDYAENIQIAELNALNASLAVIKWKKLVGFYHDHEHEYDSTYSINANLLTSDERV